MVKSKKAGDRGEGGPCAKTLDENGRSGEDFKKKSNGIGGQGVRREAPGSHPRAGVAKIVEVGGANRVWERCEIGGTIRGKTRPEGMQVGKEFREMGGVRDVSDRQVSCGANQLEQKKRHVLDTQSQDVGYR